MSIALNLKQLYKFFILSVFFYSLISCSYLQKKSKISVLLKGEQIFPKKKTFKGLKVGGLSGLFYDKKSGNFFSLSDDKKNHRFYKLSFKQKPFYQIEIEEQIFLKTAAHNRLKRNMDPEDLAFLGDRLFIVSEGQQMYEPFEPPQIFSFDKNGVLKEEWPVSPVFWTSQLSKNFHSFGAQENKGFESLALDKKTLWTSTEKPLKQDLNFKDKFFIRLSAFDIESKKLIKQYAYSLNESFAGLTAFKILKSDVFITLERSYKKLKTNGISKAYLFITDCRQANDIKSQSSLQKSKSIDFQACSKKQIWSSDQSPSIQVDNLEGLALGPFLDSKKQLMLLVSDNNFNEEHQKTQFLFFELNYNK